MGDLSRWSKEQQEIDDYILKLEETTQHQKIKIEDLKDILNDIRNNVLIHTMALDVLPDNLQKILIERSKKLDLEILSTLEQS